jgi:hypothetical protein
MGRASAIRELAAARNAPRIAAAFFERTIQIWDLRSSKQMSEFDSVFASGGSRATLDPTGDVCVAAGWTGGKRGGVACYDALTGSPLWHRTDIQQTQFVRFSCIGDVIWCGAEAGRFQRLDTRTGATVDAVAGIKSVFDSPHSNLLLLETRTRGFLIRGSKDIRVPKLTSALLDAAFGPDTLCLSEAGGPVRCLDCHSGVELWRYSPPTDTHVLRLGYRPADQHFYGVQWEYQQGKSRTLFRFTTGGGQYEEICHLRSWDEEFCIDSDTLVTSNGEVISLAAGEVVTRLAFPEKVYPDEITA